MVGPRPREVIFVQISSDLFCATTFRRESSIGCCSFKFASSRRWKAKKKFFGSNKPCQNSSQLSGNHSLWWNMERKYPNMHNFFMLPVCSGLSSERLTWLQLTALGMELWSRHKWRTSLPNFDRSPGLSISEFKKEFEMRYEVHLSAGVPVTEQLELAIPFLDKIDPKCYALVCWLTGPKM